MTSFNNVSYRTLINDSYKLGTINDAVLLLDQPSYFNISKDVVMYNSFIHIDEALELYLNMVKSHISLDLFTFDTLLY